MKPIYRHVALITIIMFTTIASNAQLASTKEKNKSEMKTYVIRRDIPNAGKLTPEELKAISQTSCAVLSEMGPRIEWLHSYVTGNQIYCIYKAESENAIREHATKGGFPANEIIEVKTVISPATAGLSENSGGKKKL
jgi:hypothetical protein